MKFGYARVSTDAQCLDRQIDILKEYEVDEIILEKMTGTKINRPELMRLKDKLREGDTIIVESLSRISRSSKDLLILIEYLDGRKITLVSIKEKVDISTATGKMLVTILSALCEFERDLIKERTCEGLQSARMRGVVGGRPRISDDRINKALRLYRAQTHSIKEITDITGVSRTTLYQKLKESKN